MNLNYITSVIWFAAGVVWSSSKNPAMAMMCTGLGIMYMGIALSA